MPDEIEITWEIEDGYVGGSRPQTFKIRPSDFEDCDSALQVKDRLYDLLDEELQKRASWSCRYMDDYVQQILREITTEHPEDEL